MQKGEKLQGNSKFYLNKFALRTCGPTLWGLLPA